MQGLLILEKGISEKGEKQQYRVLLDEYQTHLAYNSSKYDGIPNLTVYLFYFYNIFYIVRIFTHVFSYLNI
jgi:hypothetical protein